MKKYKPIEVKLAEEEKKRQKKRALNKMLRAMDKQRVDVLKKSGLTPAKAERIMNDEMDMMDKLEYNLYRKSWDTMKKVLIVFFIVLVVVVVLVSVYMFRSL